MTDARVRELLDVIGAVGIDDAPVRITGHGPVIATPYPVGEAAATVMGAFAASILAVERGRGGTPQDALVDVRHASASLLSLWLASVDGRSLSPLPLDGNPTTMSEDNPLVALYPTADGRWIHLHGAFDHLAEATWTVLGLPRGASEAEVATAVGRWDAAALEQALAAAGTCGAVVRTGSEWRKHDHGHALSRLAPVVIRRIGDTPPRTLPPGQRPLEGVRVLDCTRVLAGPVSGRVLAEHGADVLLVTAPSLPDFEQSVIDTGHGKRSSHLDLRVSAERDRFEELLADADVFVQSYRGSALDRHGLGADTVAHRVPGIIHASVSCYGPGPWYGRPGWEHLAQTAAGLAAGQGAPGHPSLVPAAVCDYITGYFAALGIAVALEARARVGGSWAVEASLAQTAMWIESLSLRHDPSLASGLGDLSDLYIEGESPFGHLRVISPAVRLTARPARWGRLAVPLGTDAPSWMSADW